MKKLIRVATKRIGRPTKPPKEGERVQLGLRVTPEMKKQLEDAAIQKGRSLSQEVELRLEQSLRFENHLLLTKGTYWSPVFFMGNKMAIYITEENIMTFDISPEDKKQLLEAIGE